MTFGWDGRSGNDPRCAVELYFGLSCLTDMPPSEATLPTPNVPGVLKFPLRHKRRGEANAVGRAG